MEYRKATVDDAPILAEMRKAQLKDEGAQPICNMDAELLDFFRGQLADGSLVQWVLEDGGDLVATGGIIFFQFPPYYDDKVGIRGYITNMYTRSDYRRMGVATALLDRLTGEARARGVRRIWLGASEMGRPVYIKYGFQQIEDWYIFYTD